MSDDSVDHDIQQPPEDPPHIRLSEIAPAIGLNARRDFRRHNRLPHTGPICERDCRESKPDYEGIAEAQAAYRRAFSGDRPGQLAQRLGVGEAFLREFDLGWCEELGSVTVATVDDSACTAGIELIPLSWPSRLTQDQGPLHGLGGLIAIPSTVRRGADLVVSGDWRALEAEWVKGNNVAFQQSPAVGLGVAGAIVIRQDACGGGDVRVRMLDHATLDPVVAALHRWFWDNALKKARGEK